MKKLMMFSIIIFYIFIRSSILFTQDSISKWRAQIADKEQQIKNSDIEINQAQQEYQQILKEFENAKKDKTDKKNEYDNTKDAYDRASKNVDIISPNDLVKLLKAYQNANKDYKNSQDEEEKLKNHKNKLEVEIERLKKQKKEKEIEVLEIKANMFDEEMSKPVWSEGYGESILDENKTMKECRELALEYAKRDAMDKGGKTIIESITQVEDFIVIKDVIKAKAKVQIIEQDNSGDYGKIIRVDQGDLIKFTAKVRLKLKSVDTYNPFLEKYNELSDTNKKNDQKDVVQIEKKDKSQEKIEKNSNILIGTWYGNVNQPGYGSFQAVMTIFKLVIGNVGGKSDYPSLGCGGNLTCIDVKNDKCMFSEKINYGRNCVDGTIHLTIIDYNSIYLEWFWLNGGKGAMGTLYRKQN